LSVTDTGVGMDDATRQRIFEPFYTTKAMGSGTGLGLSVVYGVITQAKGTVRVDSAPGKGTTMRVALPLSMRPSDVASTMPTTLGDVADGVLLVDDDEAVRSTTRRLLQRHGWRVLEASDGEAAPAQFTAHRDQIAIVLSDLRMPVMDGVQLALRIRRIAADFPIVFFSGYDEHEQQAGEEMATIPLIAKPFNTADLLRVLASTLAAAR
uniref:response regulator n=1 Tax=Gemmatimonas sp. TaxID=1962908 RepID=UPI0035612F3E